MHIYCKIRAFDAKDWPAIAEIVRLIWNIGLNYLREKRYGFLVAGKSWHHHKVNSIKKYFFKHPENCFITEVKGRVIGFCSMSFDYETKIGQVGENGIHPDYRGKGYGSKQVQFILSQLRENGMKIAEVQTGLNDGHAAARKMYEHAGFKPIIESCRYYLTL